MLSISIFGYFSISFLQVTGFVILIHFLMSLIDRIHYLSFKAPKIPIGQRRQIKWKTQNPVLIDTSEYYQLHFTFVSIMIVPYEKNVLYVDGLIKEQTPEECKGDEYVLTYQERLHSYIHNKMNADFFKHIESYIFLSLLYIFNFLSEIIINCLVLLPNLMSAVNAIFELCFYYIEEIEDHFKILPKNNTFCKVFLWHYYEEIEHNQESCSLFIKYQGAYRYFYCVVGFVVLYLLILSIQIFTMLTIIFVSPLNKKLHLLLQAYNHTCKWSGCLILGMLLLIFNLNADDNIVQKDLERFRKLYKERFNEALEDGVVTFE